MLGLLAGYLIAFLPPAAVADTYVLLVAIDEYADKQVQPRAHAEADAKALYDLFTHKDHLGVRGSHIRLLLGRADSTRPSEIATKDNILKSLHWLGANAKQSNVLILAWIGRGVLRDDVYYLGTDSSAAPVKNAITLEEIEDALCQTSHQACICGFIDMPLELSDVAVRAKWAPSPETLFAGLLGSDDVALSAVRKRVIFLPSQHWTAPEDVPAVVEKDGGSFRRTVESAVYLLNSTKGEPPCSEPTRSAPRHASRIRPSRLRFPCL